MLDTQRVTLKPFDETRSFLMGIVDSFEGLHGLLELSDLENLPYALRLAQNTLNRIYDYPNGPMQLKEDLERYPEEQKKELMSLLDIALKSHQQNAVLIDNLMNRKAAEQASSMAQNASSATYGRGGSVAEPMATILSHSA
jgi:hypothetical protein